MFRLEARPIKFLRRQSSAWWKGVAGVGALSLVVGLAEPAFPRPPFSDPQGQGQGQGRRQIEDAQRSDIRRSLDYNGYEARQEGARERRRMSDAERQSLRQAVRDAYGDPRNRPRN